MTFSVAQFGARARAQQDGYLVVSADNKRIGVFSKGEWAEHDVQWRKEESSKAKKEFVDCLIREFGREITDLLTGFIPGDGTPLGLRDVVDIIDVGEAYRLAGVGENQTAENALANDPEIDALIADLDKGFDFESRGRRPRVIHREIPKPPPAPPAAPQVQAPAPVVTRPTGSHPPMASLWGAHRQPQNKGPKGKEPEEPRAAPKSTDPGDPGAAKIIQDKAWKDLNQVFKATVDHVAKAQDGTAKTQIGGSKKKAGKKGDTEAAGAEDKFQLIGGERAFADLFVRPPELDDLSKLLVKNGVETKHPLSVYFDLPKSMDNWLSRMRNAEIKLDAEQVIREIDATIKHLGKDITAIDELIEDRSSKKLTSGERDRLSEVRKRLAAIYESICEDDSPLQDLKGRCTEVQKVLPEDLPQIDQDSGYHYLAYYALTEQMGIAVDPHTDTSDLIKLANRMMRIHSVVRRGLSEGETWQDIYDNASPGDRSLLAEYRENRLTGIKQQVKNETGVTMEFVDGKDGQKIYYLSADNSEAERKASYLLSTIAFAMGGSHRELLDVFGYVKWTLEDVLKEQAKRAREQAAATA
jgi:hypothetical protein